MAAGKRLFLGQVNSKDEVIDGATEQKQDVLIDKFAQAQHGDGSLAVSELKTQFEYRWSDYNPANLLTFSADSVNHDVGNTVGGAFFRTKNVIGAICDVQTPEALAYSARHFMLHDKSFLFENQPQGTGRVRAGAYTDLDGVMIEQTATETALILMFNGDDETHRVVFGPGGDQNGDPLNGNTDPTAGPVTRYTKGGVGAPFDITKFQICDFEGSWRGVDTYDVFFRSPDKTRVLIHSFYFINEAVTPSFSNPNLPIRVRLENGDTAQILGVLSNCWSAATNVDKRPPVKSRSNASATPLTASGPGSSYIGGLIPSRFYAFSTPVVSADKALRLRAAESDDGLIFYYSDWYDWTPGDPVFVPTWKRTHEFVRYEVENTSGATQGTFDFQVYLDDVIAADIPTQQFKKKIAPGHQVVPVRAGLSHEGQGGNVLTGEDDPLPVTFVKTLTERMVKFEPAAGYQMWMDTEDAEYRYLMEAPTGSTPDDNGFRGIRIPQSNVGAIEVNTAANLSWNDRASHGGWA